LVLAKPDLEENADDTDSTDARGREIYRKEKRMIREEEKTQYAKRK